MYDIIANKRSGKTLSNDEIRFFIEGYTNGRIPDYQVSALLMAIYFQGMDMGETACLTHCMAHSGDVIDLSPIPGIKVDKHSTGGVGDKTSLIAAPIVAACGVPVAKMAGRGLGHTGGTIDKLESIPGFETEMDRESFFEIVRREGISIIGQTGNIAPGDKKLYALRDVTATVESLPLIASSVMSKKLAAGADAILLDVKTGSGAFMKTLEESIELAKAMVSIGERLHRKTVALITNMDVPLGNAIGNSLEVTEAVQALKGEGPKDLTQVCLAISANMLYLANRGTLENCEALAETALFSGRAFEKLKAMTKAQGGDTKVLDDPGRFPKAPFTSMVYAPDSGYITRMDTAAWGTASVALGAGREKKGDDIDHSAGICLFRKTGDRIERGEAIARLYTSKEKALQEAEEILLGAISIGNEKVPAEKLIRARVTFENVEIY